MKSLTALYAKYKEYILPFLLLLPGTIVVYAGIDAHYIGFYEGCSLYTRFIYPIFHASFFHMAFNAYCFVLIMRILRKTKAMSDALILIISYISAVACTFVSEMSLPTIGLSGVIYAMIGIYSYLRLSGCLWNVLIILLINIIAYHVGTSNVFIHLSCWACGFALTFFWDLYYVLKYLYNERNRQKNIHAPNNKK